MRVELNIGGLDLRGGRSEGQLTDNRHQSIGDFETKYPKWTYGLGFTSRLCWNPIV